VTRLDAARYALLIVGLAILLFGGVTIIVPAEPVPYVRAIGVASIGMGLFGSAITMTAFRRRERWVWAALWYYPVFWLAHLLWDLPPGQDHVHQVVFIALSLAALLAATPDFSPRAGSAA
jgi:hypothetical protein